MIRLGIGGGDDSKPLIALGGSPVGGGNFDGTFAGGMGGAAATGSGFARLAPQIRNPLLNVVNFYLPQDRKVLNQWVRYYEKFHPIVGNCLDLHAETIISPFDLEGIDDSSVMNVYRDMVFDNLELFEKGVQMMHELYLIGETFNFCQWNETKGIFDHCVVLDPDLVHCHNHPFIHLKDAATFEVEPSESLTDFVNSSDPMDMKLRQFLDPTIIAAVKNNQMMKLSSFNVTAMMRKSSPYEDRGTSIVLKAIKWLMYEDKLMEANYAIADGHVTPRWIFKLGDPTSKIMPRKKDLQEFRDNLMRGWYDQNTAIVSTYALQVEAIGSMGKVLPLVAEYQWVEDRVLTALFTHKLAINGTGPSYNNASVARQIMNGRYATRRAMFEAWVIKKIFTPVAKAHGFYKPLGPGEKGKSKKERELWIPTINWRTKLDSTDTQEFKEFLMRMRDKTGVSARTIFKYMGLDYKEEEQSLMKETGSVFDPVFQEYRKKHAETVFEQKEKGTVTPGQASGMIGGGGMPMGGGGELGGGDMGGGDMGGEVGGDVGPEVGEVGPEGGGEEAAPMLAGEGE